MADLKVITDTQHPGVVREVNLVVKEQIRHASLQVECYYRPYCVFEQGRLLCEVLFNLPLQKC